MRKILWPCLLFFSNVSMGAEIMIDYPKIKHPLPAPSFLTCQIIQDEIKFDNSAILNAKILTNADGSFSGLEIELKSSAAKKFEHMTNSGIHHPMNIVINNTIISSPIIQSVMSKKMLIVSITREKAQAFVDSLNYSKFQRAKRNE